MKRDPVQSRRPIIRMLKRMGALLAAAVLPLAMVVVMIGPEAGTASAAPWPSDWAGSSYCAAQHGSAYMNTSFRGVAACGNAYPNNYQGAITYNGQTLDSVGFQCYELAARYVYYETGNVPPATTPARGYASDQAYTYGTAFNYGVYPAGATGGTGTFQSSLTVGQIVSMWSSSDQVGHVGIVINVQVSNGTGSITIMDENASSTGIDTITVSSGRMSIFGFTTFQWTTNFPGTQPPPPAGHPIYNQAHGLCLDAAAQTLANNGGIVQLWACVGDANQNWYSVGHEIVNQANGKCLDANWGTDGNNGGLVQMWSCNNGPNQQWILDGSSRYVNQAHRLCLDANWGTDGNNGGLVQLWSCNTGANQQWKATPPSRPSYGPYHVIVNGTLHVHSGPGTNYPLSAPDMANGATFYAYCQAPGTSVNGNAWWDLLTTGGYISDYYTSTPGAGPSTSGIPAC
jgi:hypothetical protein